MPERRPAQIANSAMADTRCEVIVNTCSYARTA